MRTARNDPCPCGIGKKYKKMLFIQKWMSINIYDSGANQLIV
ncbi:MAG: SEC-C domain-containing protein [Calditrichaeota bacterium]|nr:SEC-C domain-containing protein [Calditrichota bacterium]MCB0270642.1 SEC-C domain-containing protein [Calditrichota bacterium]MCB0286562.1 SEC-C domain-containing protein [Calditrichota bacterium]MCB9070236.1 SEC-C domain-containing protein [Calditrichia bacterium]